MYFERITVWLGVTVDQDQKVQEFPLVCQCRQVYPFKTFKVRVVWGDSLPCLVEYLREFSRRTELFLSGFWRNQTSVCRRVHGSVCRQSAIAHTRQPHGLAPAPPWAHVRGSELKGQMALRGRTKLHSTGGKLTSSIKQITMKSK